MSFKCFFFIIIIVCGNFTVVEFALHFHCTYIFAIKDLVFTVLVTLSHAYTLHIYSLLSLITFEQSTLLSIQMYLQNFSYVLYGRRSCLCHLPRTFLVLTSTISNVCSPNF